MGTVEYDVLHPSYRALYDLIGEDAMMKVYNEFRGTQLQLPMRLYDRAAVTAKLAGKSVDAKSIKSYSKIYGFSPRWIKSAVQNHMRGEVR